MPQSALPRTSDLRKIHFSKGFFFEHDLYPSPIRYQPLSHLIPSVPDHVRPRVCSLPERPYNPRASDDLYRLRHFSISKGNVVNCGDSIISRRSRSNTSVNSTNSRASERSPFEGSCCGAGYANVDSLPATPDDSENLDPPPPARYRVVMLGDAGVGKTALVNQFMTSEYMHTYDASLGKLRVR